MEDEGYVVKMQKLCTCGHVRGMHHYGFSRIPEGQEIQPTRTDAECRGNDCECGEYDPAEKDSEAGTVPAAV